MRLRIFAALSLLTLATCTNDLPVAPGGGAVLRIQPAFPSSFALFAQALSIQSAAITVTSVLDSTVLLHTVTGFNPASDTLRLAVTVPFRGDSASVSVALSFLDQNGAALFVDTIPLVSLVRGEAAAPALGQFPVRYVGPGSNASSITLSPPVDTIAGSGALQFTITALDDVGDSLPQVYVHWASSNSHAHIDANGRLTGPGTSGGTTVYATVPSNFGQGGFLQDSAQVTFTGPAPANAGTIHGSVVDGSTLLPDSGATIQAILVGDGTSFNATTGASGTYTLGSLPAGTYNDTISAAGYVGTKYLNAVMPAGSGVVIVLPPVPLAPTSPNQGTLNGSVTDAQTDTVLIGASVTLFANANAQGTTILASTTVDSTGTFSFTSLAPGTYTLEASAAGHVVGDRTTVVFGDITNFNQNIVLSNGGPQFRAVLTWSDTPSDLDLHADYKDSLGVSDSTYYGNHRGDSTGTALDHDEQQGFGPETITIYQKYPGVDTFFVVNYSYIDSSPDSPDTTLARSGATVRVYNNNALLSTMYVPNQPGTQWNLFSWNGTTLTPINTMSYVSGGGVVGAPGRGAPKGTKPKAARRR